MSIKRQNTCFIGFTQGLEILQYNYYTITLYYLLWVLYDFNNLRFFNWFYNFRENMDGQLLNRSEAHMIESTTYNPENPIKMIVHGWNGCSSNNCSVCTFIVNGKLLQNIVLYRFHEIKIMDAKNMIVSSYFTKLWTGKKKKKHVI